MHWVCMSRQDRYLHISPRLAHLGSVPARLCDSIGNCSHLNAHMQQVGVGGVPSITVAPGRGQVSKPLPGQSQLPAQVPGRQNGGIYGVPDGAPQQEQDRIWANNIWTVGDPAPGEQTMAA